MITSDSKKPGQTVLHTVSPLWFVQVFLNQMLHVLLYILPSAMKNSNINCTVSNVMFAISVPLDP